MINFLNSRRKSCRVSILSTYSFWSAFAITINGNKCFGDNNELNIAIGINSKNSVLIMSLNLSGTSNWGNLIFQSGFLESSSNKSWAILSAFDAFTSGFKNLSNKPKLASALTGSKSVPQSLYWTTLSKTFFTLFSTSTISWGLKTKKLSSIWSKESSFPEPLTSISCLLSKHKPSILCNIFSNSVWLLKSSSPVFNLILIDPVNKFNTLL